MSPPLVSATATAATVVLSWFGSVSLVTLVRMMAMVMMMTIMMMMLPRVFEFYFYDVSVSNYAEPGVFCDVLYRASWVPAALPGPGNRLELKFRGEVIEALENWRAESYMFFICWLDETETLIP